MAGEAVSRASLTLAFQRRRDLEWRKLRKHLHLQLQHDIERIYTNSLYCDLELVFNSTAIHTHRSILQVRAARFFTKLSTLPSHHNGLHSVAFDTASVDYIKDFVRNIYSKCAIAEEEVDVVEYLEELNEPNHTKKSAPIPFKAERGGSFDSGLSPESDIYLTPNCSPSEIYQDFHTAHSLDTTDLSTATVEPSGPIANLHKTNRSYYSIVPVDEVFREEGGLECATKDLEIDYVLERELAEQDELLKSFRSIKSKEERRNNVKKINKPTSLPFSSSHYTKKKKRGCDIIYDRERSNKKEKGFCDSKVHSTLGPTNNNAIESVIQYSIKDYSSENIFRGNVLKKDRFDQKGNTIKEEEESECAQESGCLSCKDKSDIHCNKAKSIYQGHNGLLEEEEFMCSPAEAMECGLDCCKKKQLLTEDSLNFPCSPEMDASGGGPDSGLDTSSTGCMPGGGFSSPREHTVSETSGVDLTDAAVGEDMPHDGELPIHKSDKSSASSSVSSDAGTWDSTFPPANHDDDDDDDTNQKCIPKTDMVVDTTCLTLVDNSQSFKEPFNLTCHEVDNNVPLDKPSLTSHDREVDLQIGDTVDGELNVDETSENNPAIAKREDQPNELHCVEKLIPELDAELVDRRDIVDYHSCTKVEPCKNEPFDADAIKDTNTSEITLAAGSDLSVVKHERELTKIGSSLGSLQAEYLLDTHQPSSGEKCSEWRIETSVGSKRNYFINAASLVDDSELPSSLPPFYVHEVSYKTKVGISSEGLCEKEDKDLDEVLESTKSLPTYFEDELSNLYTSEDVKVSTSSCIFPENLHSTLNSDIVSKDETQALSSDMPSSAFPKESQVEQVDDVSISESPAMKFTFLKSSGLRHDAKMVNGQDIVAEFQKEIKLTEHLEPHSIVRKVLVGRRRWDSCSEDVPFKDETASVKDFTSEDTVALNSNEVQDMQHQSLDLQDISQEVEEDLRNSELSKTQSHTNSKRDASTSPGISASSIISVNFCEDELRDVSTSPGISTTKVNLADICKNVEDGAGDTSKSPEEPRRSSLIRRNTFELDPDDDRLALLRQEYERRQGNLLFQNCIPQFSGHLTGSEGFCDTQSLLVGTIGVAVETDLHEEQQKSLPSIPSTNLMPDSISLDASIEQKHNTQLSTVINEQNLFAMSLSQQGLLYSDRPLNNLLIDQTLVNLPQNKIVSLNDKPENQLQQCSNRPNRETERLATQSNLTGINVEEQELNDTEPSDYLKRMSSSYDNSSKPVISGALTCSDIIMDEKRSWDSPKKQKRTESTPIVSGGVSTEDFSVCLHKVAESPILARRKNESAPILSGAAPVSPEPKEEVTESKSTTAVPSVSAWVVDMSNCGSIGAKSPLDSKRHKKSDTSGMDLDDPLSPKRADAKHAALGFFVDLKEPSLKESVDCKLNDGKEAIRERSQRSRDSVPAGVGYFVDLEGTKSSAKELREKKASSFDESKDFKRQSSRSEELKSSGKNSPCGFFVDLTPNDSNEIANTDLSESKRKQPVEEKDTVSTDKKNALFSMFIDIGGTKQEPSSKLGGSTESIKSKVASSPLLSTNKKLGHRRASLTRGETNTAPDQSSKIAGTTFDLEDEHHRVESPKGLFMYIDAGAPPTSRQTSTSSQTSSQDEIKEHKESKKQGFFMFIETDSPVARRKTLPSGLRPNINRHSWNPETRSSQMTEEQRINSRRQHKRAHSLSVDRSSMCSPGDDNKSSSASSLVKSRMQGSSQSLHEASISSDAGTPSRLASTSCHARLSSKAHDKFVKRAISVEGRSESDIETISEGKPLDEIEVGIKDKVTHKIKTSGNIDLKFATQDTNIGVLEISNLKIVEEFKVSHKVQILVKEKEISKKYLSAVSVQETSPRSDLMEIEKDVKNTMPHKHLENLTTDKATTSIHKLPIKTANDIPSSRPKPCSESCVTEPVRQEQSNECTTGGSFVKLSDLDKEPVKTLDDLSYSSDVLPSFATANRMTRSIPETSWIESKLLMTRSIGGGTSSRSLSRLFPHLHTTMTATSSPSSLNRSKSPGGQPDIDDNETQVSETSDLSSMQSSMGPSGLEGSTEETDASSSYAGRSGPVSRLGEDLLRMFLEEINPDVTVEVGGRRLKAHKCILSSRCQYFAAMLSGGWVESAGNVISLQGFSYNAVHFALCHIYSGTSNIPDTISIVELATLADMLGLEGLKEVIMYTLKVKYCHFFHKPCTMCAVGVLECLPLAAAYGLDDIYRKSLRWITKYFVRIWPTKGFASLPRELIEKCYQQHVVHMSVDNILETVMCCDKLLATLPNVRWAEPVFGITSQLLEAAIKFIANNFSGVLTSENFLSLGKELSWNISRLEDSIMAATDRLPPDQACQSHARLHHILTVAQSPEPPPEMQWSPSFVELLNRIQKRVEASLVRQAPRAARCQSWSQMEPELRKKIQEAACLVLVPGEEGHRSRHASLSRRVPVGSSSSPYCTGPRSVSTSGSRNLDLRQVKLAMTQQARRAASGGRVSMLKADTKPKSQPKQAQAAPVKKESEESGKTANGEAVARPKTWPMRVLETKSRSVKYRANSSTSSMGTPEKSGSVPRRTGKTMISSSDSSRTSSPAMRRSTPGSEGSGRGRTSTAGSGTGRNLANRSDTPPSREVKIRRKRDGEATTMSTDSLTESPSNGSGKRATKDTSENATTRSCMSTRPDTPSVRRRIREEVVMSTDSLASMVNGEKPTGKEGTSISAPSQSSVGTRPDTPKERGRHILGRLGLDVTMSTDSLATTESSFTGDTIAGGKVEEGKVPKSPLTVRLDGSKGSAGKIVKLNSGRSENQQRSPAVSVRRATTRQSIASPRDSPTARLRSGLTSSPYTGSPSLRRSLLLAAKSPTDNGPTSVNDNSRHAAPAKATKSEKIATKLLASPSASISGSKRTPTRLQARMQFVASPAKACVDATKPGIVRNTVKDCGGSKAVTNTNKVNNNSVKKPTNGNVMIGKNKRNCDTNMQTKVTAEVKKGESSEDKSLTVGSRSGTFLKDEPTILKKPDVDNVQE